MMPKVLWKKSVKIAHEGHQGLAKTKALIREKMFCFRLLTSTSQKRLLIALLVKQ